MKQLDNNGTDPAGANMLPGVTHTVSYADVVVTAEDLKRLKAEQNAAPLQAKYGRYKAWLNYANLDRWQRQGYHFHYSGGMNSEECTCGLEITQAAVDADGIAAELIGGDVAQLLDGVELDEVQRMKGHRTLPGFKALSVALIVGFEWREDLRKYLWNAICQQCGGYEIGATNVVAKRFVRTHNKSCSSTLSQGTIEAFNQSLVEDQESDGE